MSGISGLKVVFVAGFGPLVKDPAASKAFYVDVLGLPLEQQAGGGYYHGEKLDGVRHFALWPLSEAAQSCFGANAWPADVPEPHSWLEFDVEDVATATAALKCQSALDWDPLSASKRAPFERRVRPVALAPSELAGVAETVRARAV